MPKRFRVKNWQWTKDRVQCLEWVVEGLSDEEIARRLKTTSVTVKNWRLQEPFEAKRVKLVEEFEKEIFSRGLANKAHRLMQLNEIYQRQKRIVEQRSEDPILTSKDEHGLPAIPGGDTGFVVVKEQTRVVGMNQKTGRPIFGTEREYKHDRGLSQELREIMEQAAVEAGHRDRNAKDSDTTPLTVNLSLEIGAALSEHIETLRAFRRNQAIEARSESAA